jgi:hypothetical protein
MIVDKLERNIHDKFMNKANVGLANLKKTQRIKVEILLRLDAHKELGKKRDNTTFKYKVLVGGDFFFIGYIIVGEGGELGVHWVVKRYSTHLVLWHPMDGRNKDE